MSQINIASLDFDDIKQNLKEFLQSQDEFTDYDFEGSALSVLLDVLSLNTHYMSYYGNMVLTEAFLDSAVKRSSAISIAKHLGYTPVSVRGAVASINVKVIDPDDLPPTITIEPYTPFTTTISDNGFNFLTTKAYVASRQGNEYNFLNVEVKEGSLQEFSYVVTDPTPKSKYEIPALNVDTTTISVIVQKSATDITKEIYTLTEDLTKLTGESKVFFLEQNPLERYQIYFGDNILGKAPINGNIITIRYLVSQGATSNISDKIDQTFAASASIGGSNNITVTTNSNSTGGRDKESITSIKHYAPKFNAAKNRCVTSSDFEALIHTNYSGAESIAVWGGEDNSPPIYGKVFVSLKPYEGFIVSEESKEKVKSEILKSKQGVTIQVEFVEPEYIYVGLNISVDYNYTITTKTSNQIYNLVIAAVESYFSTNLQKFNADYKHSTLSTKLVDVDEAISSVLISLTLQKRVIPVLNTTNVLNLANALNFRNSIEPGTLESSFYYIDLNGTQTLVYINDLPNTNPADAFGTGTLRLVNAGDNSIINSNIGTIDYGSGTVSVDAVTPVALPAGAEDIRFTCSIQERSYNINCNRNEILILDRSVENKITGTSNGLTVLVNGVV